MSKIKINFSILDKDFEFVEKEISIDQSDFDPKTRDIWYSYRVPDHIYNALLDTAPEYTVEKGFKKTITYISISMLLDRLNALCIEISSRKDVQKQKREKKIFVKFSHSAKHKRCEWTGGYMGEVVGSSFQFFIGYKIMQPEGMQFDDNVKLVPFYYTLIRYQKTSSIATVQRYDTDFKEGKDLQPLHMKHERKAFEEEYAILDWSQEAEDFLTSIQNKFKDLHSYLDQFLGNLNNDKLQQLMQNNNLKLLNS